MRAVHYLKEHEKNVATALELAELYPDASYDEKTGRWTADGIALADCDVIEITMERTLGSAFPYVLAGRMLKNGVPVFQTPPLFTEGQIPTRCSKDSEPELYAVLRKYLEKAP